jgi:hypothetical protein
MLDPPVPSQLPFRIAFATSEWDDNRAINLINSSPYSDGWISSPNSPLSQHLILDFGSIVSLTQIQFVSHQTKIPANIFLSVSRDPHWRTAVFKDIDSFQFSDNRQRGYKAREVRSAKAPSLKLRFLKLTIDQLHPNRFNRDNQVGIVSITAFGIGEPREPDDPDIGRLAREKQAAIASQDFLRAHSIKMQMQAAEDARHQLVELKRQTEEAVRQANYYQANQLKQQIENIQSGNYPPVVPPIEEPPPISARPRIDDRFDLPVVPEKVVSANDIDSRPIRPAANGRYHFDEETIGDEPTEKVEKGKKGKAKPRKPRKEENLLEFPEDAPDEEQDSVEELGLRDRQDADILITAVGEGAVRLFYSKAGANKVNGIKGLSDGIQSARASQHGALFARFSHLLRLRLKEELIGVFPAAVAALMSLADNLNLASENVRVGLEPHLPVILSRLGHKREQIAEAAKGFVLWAAENDALGLGLIGPMLIAPLKKPVTSSNVQERLVVVQELVERFGTVDGGFDVATIVSFVFVALDAKEAGVRSAACQVCRVLAGMGAASQITRMLLASNLSTQTQTAVRNAMSK